MKEDKTLVRALRGEAVWPPPVWLMRQAGRYLPEYRALRAKAGSFLTMCDTPALATEITLQPIRRFGFDGAILFSDILTVPQALGVKVWFEEGHGPRLTPIQTASGLETRPEIWAERLSPAYQALQLVKAELSPETSLLGFAGAPWTLATYLAQGQGSDDQRAAKLWAYRDPTGFAALIDQLVDCVAAHLIAQLDAGADAVQIFDSWASGLTAENFARWSVEPAKRIVAKIRAKRPDALIIGFPRATTLAGYELYARETGVNAVSLDTSAPLDWAGSLPASLTLQGNLDPIALVAGGEALSASTGHILQSLKGRPFIFNLGHGVVPETPPEHVGALVQQIRSA